MNEMYLNVGDWSKDGHECYGKILVKVNKTVEEVQQGYKDSCKLTGLSFNHNEDYTGKGLGYGSPYQIATEYEDPAISSKAIEILKEFGIVFEMDLDESEYYINGTEDFTNIWFQFVQLSIPDLQWGIVKKKDNIPNINGFRNNNLNCQFGYGLF